MNGTFRGRFPSEILSLEIRKLHEALGGPALFHIPGNREPALLVSVLLHGNEHTGFLALREWLRPYALGTKPLPRSLWLFIGNTAAAEQNLRHLSTQPDFNRVWQNHPDPSTTFAREVLAAVNERPPFAAVDIHNNSGKNPHYACVARWERHHLQLAALFGRTVVHTDHPTTTFTHVMSDLCPSITLECGISGEPHGTAHAIEFLESAIHLSEFPARPVAAQDVDGFETVARVSIRDGVEFSFSSESQAELTLRPDLDGLNFSELAPGTLLGTYRGSRAPLRVENSAGVDPGLLTFAHGEIRTARTISPAMFTVSKRAILEDCLGYLMVHKPVVSELP